MILIMVMHEFDRKLTEISDLIHNMECGNYQFERDAVKMVLDIEEMAERYSLPIQADLALVRGKLLCGYPEEKASLLSRKERGREKQRYIVTLLFEAVKLVEDYFRGARKQFNDCEQVCGQIIVNAFYKGLHQQNQDLYVLVSQDADLGPHLAEVHSAVGCANARVIFEEAKVYTKYNMD